MLCDIYLGWPFIAIILRLLPLFIYQCFFFHIAAKLACTILRLYLYSNVFRLINITTLVQRAIILPPL